MILTLITLSSLLFISISFNSYSVALPYSFIWGIFLCLLILSNSLFVPNVLGKSTISPHLESSGLVYKEFHADLYYNPPWSLEPAVPGVFLCRLCAPSCCDWAITGVGTLVKELSAQLNDLLCNDLVCRSFSLCYQLSCPALASSGLLVVGAGSQPGFLHLATRHTNK